MVAASGNSGGLVNGWNTRKFKKLKSVEDRNFLITTGVLIEDGTVINFVNVYAPQKVRDKRLLWERLKGCMLVDKLWVFMGDFNSVRWKEERKNSKFNVGPANDFNLFIDEANLQEYKMNGNRFTFLTGSGNDAKMSKIDRVLVSQEFFNRWPGACLRVLPREISDHCPLLLSVSDCNYGAKPFKWFNSWLDREGCEQVVIAALESSCGIGPADVMLHKKLIAVRNAIKDWWKRVGKKEEEDLCMIKDEIASLEKCLEVRELEEEEIWVWEESKKEVEKMLLFKNRDMQQKSRVS